MFSLQIIDIEYVCMFRHFDGSSVYTPALYKSEDNSQSQIVCLVQQVCKWKGLKFIIFPHTYYSYPILHHMLPLQSYLPSPPHYTVMLPYCMHSPPHLPPTPLPTSPLPPPPSPPPLLPPPIHTHHYFLA